MAWTAPVQESPATRLSELSQSRRRDFRGVRRPGSATARIDRLLVCPSGVHVVTLSATGRPGAEDAHLRESVESAHAVASLLPPRYRGRVRPVLSCRGEEPLADLVEGVLVTSPETFDHIARSSPAVLSSSEVQQLVTRLEGLLEPYPLASATTRGAWSWLGRFMASGLAGGAATTALLFLTGQGGPSLPW